MRGGARRRLATARRIHERYLELFRVNFVSPNPVPVKAALAEMGLIEDVLRQPLLPLADPQRARLRAVLDGLGLLGRPDATAAWPSPPRPPRLDAADPAALERSIAADLRQRLEAVVGGLRDRAERGCRRRPPGGSSAEVLDRLELGERPGGHARSRGATAAGASRPG